MVLTQLMLGDWVFVAEYDEYTPAPHNKPYPVQILHGADIDRADEISFEPIPLTPEILEKNGWIRCKYETCKSVYEYKGLHLRHAMIKRSNGRWVANVDGIIEKFSDEYTHSHLRINVFHVHELQHALRLCGLNELADNFKI